MSQIAHKNDVSGGKYFHTQLFAVLTYNISKANDGKERTIQQAMKIYYNLFCNTIKITLKHLESSLDCFSALLCVFWLL